MKLDLQFPSKSLFLDFQYKHGYVSHILALLFLRIISTTGDETNPINYIFSETMAQTVNNPPVSAGDLRDVGSIPGWGRSPGGGNGSLLWYCHLENPTDREAWWATVQGVAKNQT